MRRATPPWVLLLAPIAMVALMAPLENPAPGLPNGQAWAEPDGSDLEAYADSLAGGVMIVHVVPELTYTHPGPADGWCAFCDLMACEGQINRVGEGTTVWYVVSAWAGEKTFSAVEFGLGDYDPNLYVIVDHDPCWRHGMTLHFPDITKWPAPNTGIALAATRENWVGRFVPIYWFAGYHYEGEGQIPLAEFPPTQHAGWVNAARPSTTYDAACLGALGVGTAGRACCPEGPDGEVVSEGN
ncbi:MAG: hypothetical protein KAY32_09310 [Candidatus Eisenbacteria sp.]|nr:hypothetical protein [Candidatus Eisenbacteria bacterium]